jgi:hypothetical protein
LIPIPPALYRPLPTVVKRTILLDFPFYRFDESDAIKGVALYRNCGIVEQYGNLKTRIKGVGTGKAPRPGKGGRERIPFF